MYLSVKSGQLFLSNVAMTVFHNSMRLQVFWMMFEKVVAEYMALVENVHRNNIYFLFNWTFKVTKKLLFHLYHSWVLPLNPRSFQFQNPYIQKVLQGGGHRMPPLKSNKMKLIRHLMGQKRGSWGFPTY